MCWNATVSINTFAVSLFAIIFAYLNGYSLLMCIGILGFSMMQLNEYFLWKYLNNKRLNMIFSMVAAATILIQPILAILLLDKGILKNVFIVLYGLFLLANILLFLSKNPSTSYFNTSVAKNGHLLWNWMGTPHPITLSLYLIIVLVPLWLKYKWIWALLTFTFIASFVIYRKEGTWGSMWCWSINVISIILLTKILFWDHFCDWKARFNKK